MTTVNLAQVIGGFDINLNGYAADFPVFNADGNLTGSYVHANDQGALADAWSRTFAQTNALMGDFAQLPVDCFGGKAQGEMRSIDGNYFEAGLSFQAGGDLPAAYKRDITMTPSGCIVRDSTGSISVAGRLQTQSTQPSSYHFMFSDYNDVMCALDDAWEASQAKIPIRFLDDMHLSSFANVGPENLIYGIEFLVGIAAAMGVAKYQVKLMLLEGAREMGSFDIEVVAQGLENFGIEFGEFPDADFSEGTVVLLLNAVSRVAQNGGPKYLPENPSDILDKMYPDGVFENVQFHPDLLAGILDSYVVTVNRDGVMTFNAGDGSDFGLAADNDFLKGFLAGALDQMRDNE